jgi:hypothetical protein
MTTLENSPLVSCVIDGISVIYICPLLDVLYTGQDRWMEASNEDRCDRVVKWINENGAHYHAWSGESYLGLAERNVGIEEAKKLGKSIVVIEPLS